MLPKGKAQLCMTSFPAGKYKHTNIMAFATDSINNMAFMFKRNQTCNILCAYYVFQKAARL